MDCDRLNLFIMERRTETITQSILIIQKKKNISFTFAYIKMLCQQKKQKSNLF